ncbi:MAG: bacillithiol biosynthesis deacetylase BshB1 [bacterium]
MNVVAFAAHPDDVELYAGGLCAGLARGGATLVLVDLTRGELGTRGDVATRSREAEEAARILGARRECLGLPDGGLAATDPAQTRAVVEALRRHRPALVIAPWEDDPHPDHREASHLVRRARFLARLPRYAAAGEAFAVGPVLWYEQKTSFVPDVVVDIGADLAAKSAAIRAFASQFFRTPDDPVRTEVSDPAFHEMLEARARVHGYRIGVEWGEGYKREGPHAVTDARQLLGSAAVSAKVPRP